MTTNNENEKSGAADPRPSDVEKPAVCEHCGTPTASKMFRTGSVKHPASWKNVCPNCGSSK